MTALALGASLSLCGQDASHRKISKTPPRSIAEAVTWLKHRSTQMIRECRTNTKSGIAAFPPQVGSHYNAFWLRDYAYMLEGNPEAFSENEVKDAYRYFLAGQREDGAMMDCIRFDGKTLYTPGGFRGSNPIADGSQFAVDVAWHTFKRTRDVELVGKTVDQLIKAMKAVPRNPVTGMVHIKPGADYDRCGYGFTDEIKKQGDELFCSLLYIQASRQLAKLLEAAVRIQEAEQWLSEGRKVSDKIGEVFWDSKIGLFRAATIVCKQPDIWGSAFAVYNGVADETQSRAVARYFEKHYREIVKRGQLRHLPAGMVWEAMSDPLPPGTFQNGAFWATPIGWFVYALDLANPKLADQTVIDMVSDFIATGAESECVNDRYANVPHYLASAALPLDGIRTLIARRKAGAKSSASK